MELVCISNEIHRNWSFSDRQLNAPRSGVVFFFYNWLIEYYCLGHTAIMNSFPLVLASSLLWTSCGSGALRTILTTTIIMFHLTLHCRLSRTRRLRIIRIQRGFSLSFLLYFANLVSHTKETTATKWFHKWTQRTDAMLPISNIFVYAVLSSLSSFWSTFGTVLIFFFVRICWIPCSNALGVW